MPRHKLSNFEIKLRETISTNLKNLTRGISQQKLSDMTGIPASTISGYFAQRSTPNPGAVQKIADALNVEKSKIDPRFTSDLLESVNQSSDLIPDITPIYNQLTPDRQTKVYKFATSQLDEQNEPDEEDADDDNVIDIITGRATAAGSPINGDDQDGLATMERVSVTDIPHGTDEIVTVDGDSMEPYYPKYSQIFVHWQDTIEDGELAVVHVCDEGVTFKQIYLDDDEKKIILHSLNDKYDDREFEADEIHIIGKVLN